MSKKLVALALVVLLSLLAVSALAFEAIPKDEIIVGAVFIGPKDDGFTGAHYNGLETMRTNLGLSEKQVLYKFNVPENAEVESAIRELVDAGCHIIFGNSWGYMNFMDEMAEEFPEVIFSHCSGFMNNGENFNNYFGRIYQSRYLAGIAAGMRTESNQLGFVAAFPDLAEVNGGINAFTLGAQSVNPDVTVHVKYINSWGDPTLEKQTAEALLAIGCDVIAQHCDSDMPQVAAEQAGKWGCGYNRDMTPNAPEGHLTAPIWNWGVFYTMEVKDLIDGTWECVNYFPGLAEGFVDISPLSANCAEGTAEAIEAARAKIVSGEWDVFTGEIYNNKGELAVAAGEKLSDGDITGAFMSNLLVKGVVVD